MLSLFRHFFGLIVLIGFLTPVLAEGDPPARVGRLSLAEGDVTFRADRQDPGNPAVVNWPVSSGAILDTGGRSRAEVWIGSTAYRLAGNSRAEFVTVDDRQVSLQLVSGTLAVTIRDRNQADDLEIETPEGRVRFAGTGRYRIEARSDRTTVAAQSGSAEVSVSGRSLAVRAGECAPGKWPPLAAAARSASNPPPTAMISIPGFRLVTTRRNRRSPGATFRPT